MDTITANHRFDAAAMSINSWSPWMVIGFVGIPFLLIIVSFVLSFYMSNRHLDAMIDALKNCRYITARAGLRHQGWFERILLVALISGMVQWPKPGLRLGEMDPDDLREFPAYLRKLLKAKNVLTLIIVIWFLVIYVLAELR
ncbi:hypothetical protein [Pseudomonas quasicaspiana]|uniref:hypothetical protein n=1 Tax=Pseudomonas quasicaspiana TaxID=2829821 RepID=UPI001E5CEEC3|nr:hypothetical protein [Pseudomonas quasicaspiana]